MAKVTRGLTFGATENITNTKFHQIIDDSTVTLIEEADIKTGFGLLEINATQPSTPATGDIWFDSTNVLFRRFDGSVYKVLEVHVGDSQPTNTLQEGQLWVDTTPTIPLFKFYDATAAAFITLQTGTVTRDDLVNHQTQRLYAPESGTVVGVGDGFLGAFTAFTSGAGSAGSVVSNSTAKRRAFRMTAGAADGRHHGFEGDNAFMFTASRKKITVAFMTTGGNLEQRGFIGLSAAANTGATLVGSDDPAVANIIALHWINGASANNFFYAHKDGSAGAWVRTDSGISSNVADTALAYLVMDFDENPTNSCLFSILDKDGDVLDSTRISTDLPTADLKFVMGIESTDPAAENLEMFNILFTQEGA